MKRFFSLIITTGLLAVAAQAAIVITAELPGVQNTTQAGTYVTETFDGPGVPAPGQAFPGTYVSPIGTYSEGAAVVAANAYGGSYQTNYISIGAQQPSDLSYTLTFSNIVYYFGFYWPAGDAGNRIEFLDGASTVGSYRISDVIATLGLGSAYDGNPNLPGVNTGEKYVFLNFTATDPTQFTAVRFLNDSTGTGFETDNHTVSYARVTPFSDTPEPASFGLAGAALLALGLKFRRRKA